MRQREAGSGRTHRARALQGICGNFKVGGNRVKNVDKSGCKLKVSQLTEAMWERF